METSTKIMALIAERNAAMKADDFDAYDRIQAELNALSKSETPVEEEEQACDTCGGVPTPHRAYTTEDGFFCKACLEAQPAKECVECGEFEGLVKCDDDDLRCPECLAEWTTTAKCRCEACGDCTDPASKCQHEKPCRCGVKDGCVYCGAEAVCTCVRCDGCEAGDSGRMCEDCAEAHGRQLSDGEWLCGGCAEDEEDDDHSEDELDFELRFDEKHPNASCLFCKTKVTGATVVMCSEMCETWWCRDCFWTERKHCPVCNGET